MQTVWPTKRLQRNYNYHIKNVYRKNPSVIFFPYKFSNYNFSNIMLFQKTHVIWKQDFNFRGFWRIGLREISNRDAVLCTMLIQLLRRTGRNFSGPSCQSKSYKTKLSDQPTQDEYLQCSINNVYSVFNSAVPKFNLSPC